MSLQITYSKTDDLIPYVKNSRLHDEAQVNLIAKSIDEFGFNNPILVDADGGVVAGHGRLLAAKKLALDEVPTIVLGHLSEQEKRAYVIADNKLALNSKWDMPLLELELESLQIDGMELGDLGFSADELAAMSFMKDEDITDIEDFPEIDDKVPTVHKCPKCGYEWSGSSS